MTTIAVVASLVSLVLGVCLALALWKALDLIRDLSYLRPVMAGPEREALRDPEPVSDTNLAEVSAAIAQQYEIDALEQERQRLEFLSAVVDPTDGVIPKVDVDWTPDQGEQPEVPVPDPTDGSV